MLKSVFRSFSHISIDQPLRDELRKSEERFAIAFHANPLATVITSLADGRFVDFNNNYCHLTGYRREELLGNPASAVPIWDSATERRTLIENLLLRHSVHEMEARYRTAGGECRDALVSAEVIEINGEQCILSVVQDITRRKQTEHLHAVQLAVSRLLSQALAYDVSVINDIMQNLYGMCSCTSVETWTAETQGLVLVAVWPHVSPEQPSRPHVVATAFHTAEPAIQQSQGNADNHPRFDFAFPIQHRGSVLGVIHLLNLDRKSVV